MCCGIICAPIPMLDVVQDGETVVGGAYRTAGFNLWLQNREMKKNHSNFAPLVFSWWPRVCRSAWRAR